MACIAQDLLHCERFSAATLALGVWVVERELCPAQADPEVSAFLQSVPHANTCHPHVNFQSPAGICSVWLDMNNPFEVIPEFAPPKKVLTGQ